MYIFRDIIYENMHIDGLNKVPIMTIFCIELNRIEFG